MARVHTKDGVVATARVTTEDLNVHFEEFVSSIMGHTERLRSAIVASLSAKLDVSNPNTPISVADKIPQSPSEVSKLLVLPKAFAKPKRLPALRPVTGDVPLPMLEVYLAEPQGKAGSSCPSLLPSSSSLDESSPVTWASWSANRDSRGACGSYPVPALRADLKAVIQQLTSMSNLVGLDVAPHEVNDPAKLNFTRAWPASKTSRQKDRTESLEKKRKIAHMSKLAEDLAKASEVKGFHMYREFIRYWFHSKARMPNTLLARIVEGRAFFAIFMIVVVCNGVWIGFSTARQVQNPSFQSEFAAQFTEVFFLACFGLELLLKLVGLQWFFFVAADWKWNLFDSFIVLLSIPDVLLTPGSSGLHYVRMAKVLKLFRLVKLFPELQLMLHILICTLDTLFWVWVLLAFFTYCFAIAIMQSTIGFIRDATTSYDLETVQLVQRDYGSIYTTCLSMFHIISGGDWYSVMSSLRRVWWGFEIAFALYVFCMIFGVLNIVIGTFCEKAASTVERDRELRTRREQADRDTFIENMGKVFNEMDVEKTGEVDLDTFLDYVDDEKKSLYLRSCGIHTHSAHELFKYLDEIDENPDGTMDAASFVEGMDRMTGHARAMDIWFLKQDIDEIKSVIKPSSKTTQSFLWCAEEKTRRKAKRP